MSPTPPSGKAAQPATERLRWKLWNLVTRSRRVCPANAHGALIWRTQPLRGILVDSTCRRDCAATGSCWCGNLRTTATTDGSALIYDEKVRAHERGEHVAERDVFCGRCQA